MNDTDYVVCTNVSLDMTKTEVQDQEQEQEQDQDQEVFYHNLFRMVLEDLVRVTHCHGCGMKKNVCFFGYVNQYCCKGCSKYYDLCDNGHYDSYSNDYDAENTDRLPHSAISCGWCDNDYYRISFANSRYHHQWDSSQNPSGVCWPMGDRKRPCYNVCIRERPVLRIPGYNHSFYPPI